jgi:hypothetical protein
MSPELKSKLKLTFLLLITALPVTLATLSFQSAIESGTLQSTANKGNLINPPVDISQLDMRDREGSPVFKTFEEEIANLTPGEEYQIKPWLMVYVSANPCDATCEQRIYYMQQLHITLGKDMQRVRRYYLSAATEQIAPATAQLFREQYPSMGIAFSDSTLFNRNMQEAGLELGLDEQDYIFLIDPVGNVMMYYTEEHTPQDIMADLDTLLKYSSLG